MTKHDRRTNEFATLRAILKYLSVTVQRSLMLIIAMKAINMPRTSPQTHNAVFLRIIYVSSFNFSWSFPLVTLVCIPAECNLKSLWLTLLSVCTHVTIREWLNRFVLHLILASFITFVDTCQFWYNSSNSIWHKDYMHWCATKWLRRESPRGESTAAVLPGNSPRSRVKFSWTRNVRLRVLFLNCFNVILIS
jgi:hypothetical protein